MKVNSYHQLWFVSLLVLVIHVQSGEIRNLNGGTIYVEEDYIISTDMVVMNGIIKFAGQSASIILTGTNPVLKNVTINSTKTSNVGKGIIELQNTSGAVLQDLIIEGENNRRSIYCNTTANNTTITNVDIRGKIAWGILFNDMDNNTRAVDNGYNYSMGKGLYIKNFKFGNVESTAAGDGIEINCPYYRFERIRVDGVLIRKTNKTSSNGLGVAFAQCDDVEVRNIEVSNTGHDGLHFEHCTNVYAENFTITNGFRAIGVSHSKNVTIRNGSVKNPISWLHSYNDRVGAALMEDSLVENIVFDGCSDTGFLISNANGFHFKNITLKNYNGSQNYGIIHFYNQSIAPVYDSTINNVRIIRASGVKNPSAALLIKDQSKGNMISGVTVDGYSPSVVVGNGNFLV